MDVIILTEGSKSIGLGHVSRTVALSEALELYNYNIKFFINGDESVCSLIGNRHHIFLKWERELSKIEKEIKNADIVVIDSYIANKEAYFHISNLAKLCMYFDDFNRISYPKGIVVNGTLFADKLNYPNREDITYLLGPKYLPLRKHFWEVPRKKIYKEIRNILIMFGGDDIRGFSSEITRFLVENYPQYNYFIVIGSAFQEENINRLELLASEYGNVNLIYYPDSEIVMKVMLNADIGIVAAGLMTIYESICVGLPIITVITVSNQEDVLGRLEKAGFVYNAGWYSSCYIWRNIESGLAYLQSREVRIEICNLYRNTIDGMGALRLANYLHTQLS